MTKIIKLTKNPSGTGADRGNKQGYSLFLQMVFKEEVKFAVVINTYNRKADLVSRALTSALSQSPAPTEVVLIDQNPEKLVLPSPITEAKNFRHMKVNKRGISSARNSLETSTDTEWIIFCDDDGYLTEGYTDTFCRIVRENPTVHIIAGSIVREDNGDFYSPRHKIGGDINKFNRTKLLMGSNFACKLKIFRDLGGFDERFGIGHLWGPGEETDFAWKAHFRGVPMLYCRRLKVLHRRPYAGSLLENTAKAFRYGKGKGALVAKWLFCEKKPPVLYEALEMTLLPILRVLKAILTLQFHFVPIHMAILLSSYWGVLLWSLRLGKEMLRGEGSAR